ncbi:hypothetical protein BFW86_24615 [Pseudomonas fluorescens]|nr:hypothetical protein BFW86_24615 [Pseudomonas fluorescens]
MSKLPAWWAACSLADIGHIVTGKTPSTKEASFYGGSIPFIRPGDLNHSGPIVTTETFLTNAGAAEIPNLPPQSIVVTCIGNLGKVGLTTTTSATNQQINALIPDTGIDPSFVFHYCKTLRPWLEAQSSATTISIVNKSIFSKAPIPLPPAAEQTRIAAKLDELLAQVDTLKTRIDGIPARLKRFRQSVLAAAVSGRLTKNIEGSDLPPEWLLVNFSTVVSDLRYGTAQKCDYNGGETGVLRIPNIGDNGIRLNDLKSSNFSPAEIRKLSLKKGDILLIRSNGSVDLVGKSAVVGSREEGLLFAGYLIRVRPNAEKAIARYINYWLKSPAVRQVIEMTARSTSGVNNINSEEIKSLIFTMPPLSEQNEIVNRVEQLFALADQLEAKVASAQNHIDHLTQSILAKAFRGELAPQDPNDEPASMLLERIKAQRTTAPKARRGRQAAQ